MSTSGEAAEQVVRMSLDGVQVAAKISGACAKQLAVMLYAILKDQKRTKGKMRLSNMLRSGKELKVFAVKEENLQQFCTAAKKYGILYCALKDKNANDGLSDIMVRAEDASKVNRIFERFNIATVDMASVKGEIEKAKAKDPGMEPPEKTIPEKSREDRFVDELMEKPGKEQAQTENPTEARNAKSSQSEPTSEPKGKTARGASDEPQRTRPSVREELKEIKTEKKQKADTLSRNGQKTHSQNAQKKRKPKKTKER